MPDKPESIFSIDTSSLMDWQDRYYPADIFPALQCALANLIVNGRLYAPAMVAEEIRAVGSVNLQTWIKTNAAMLVPNAVVMLAMRAIQNQFPDLLDVKAEHEEADAYVIALAQMKNGTVITQVTPAADKLRPKRKYFIPDVCRELGIPCFNLLGLMRAEGWKF